MKKNVNRIALLALSFAFVLPVLACGPSGPETGEPPVVAGPATATLVPEGPVEVPTEQPAEQPTEQPPTQESGGEPSAVISPGNVRGLEPSAQLDTGGLYINALRVSSGKLFIAGQDGLRVYSTLTMEQVGLLSGGEAVLDVVISPDGGMAVTFPDVLEGAARFWDVAGGTELGILEGQLVNVWSAAFSPDGTTLATGSGEGVVTLWDVTGGQKVAEFDAGAAARSLAGDLVGDAPQAVTSITFSPDGSMLAVQPADGVLLLWEVTGATEPRIFTAVGIVAGPWAVPVVAPDWGKFGWWSRGTVHLVDMDSGAVGFRFSHEDFINSVAWSPDGRILAAATAGTIDGEYRPFVALWDATDGAELGTLADPNLPYQLVTFSPDGTQLVTWAPEGQVVVWEVIPLM